ncbi:hypothetical protein Tco_0998219 [Tanacetum coccineum]
MDLPRNIPLDSVVVLRYEKRSKSENKGKVPTEMELVLEQTQQRISYEVSISAEGVEELKRKVKIKGEKKEVILTLRQIPEPSLATQNLSKDFCFISHRDYMHFYQLSHSELVEHPSDTKVFTVKIEILLEPTSNKLLVGDM